MLRAADASEIAVARGAAEREIHVPQKQIPWSALRLVREGVLPAAVAVAVGVVVEVLRDIDLEPLAHVEGVGQRAGVGVRAERRRRERRVHQRVNVRVIILLEGRLGAQRPGRPVARHLERAARGRVAREVRAHDGVARFAAAVGRVAKLEAELDFVQLAGVVVREPLVDEVAVRLLRVVEDGAALRAVDVEKPWR